MTIADRLERVESRLSTVEYALSVATRRLDSVISEHVQLRDALRRRINEFAVATSEVRASSTWSPNVHETLRVLLLVHVDRDLNDEVTELLSSVERASTWSVTWTLAYTTAKDDVSSWATVVFVGPRDQLERVVQVVDRSDAAWRLT